MKRSYGFTLIELMVVLVVGVILIILAAPMLSGLQSNTRAAAYTNELVGAIKYARSEAITRGVPVVVRPVGSAWTGGLMVYVENGGTTGTFDSGTDEQLREWEAMQGTAITTTPSGTTYIRFEASGARTNTTAVTLSVRQTNCKNNGNRDISISTVGQVGVTPVAC